MSINFTTTHSIQRHLHGSVCLYKGELYLIQLGGVETTLRLVPVKVNGHALKNDDARKVVPNVDASDQDLQIKPWGPLKLVNTVGGVVFLTRARAGNMGINEANFIQAPVGSDSKRAVHLATTADLVNAMDRKFPTWQHAIAKAKEDGMAIAFSPNLAFAPLGPMAMGLYQGTLYVGNVVCAGDVNNSAILLTPGQFNSIVRKRIEADAPGLNIN